MNSERQARARRDHARYVVEVREAVIGAGGEPKRRAHSGLDSDVTSTRVQAVRLEKLLSAQGIERVDLIKMDTETTEPDVLAGLGQVVVRDRPRLSAKS
jgi:FkbM family methyltransferase